LKRKVKMSVEEYRFEYRTPQGFDDILIFSDGIVLTGLKFEHRHGEAERKTICEEKNLLVFKEVCRWLDIYFSGEEPDFTPDYRIDGLTPFRREVFEMLLEIPFGKTTTYGKIAAEIAQKRGIAKMSAQAVGSAVGWNPICIIVPCHRVIGADGSLTGYGGGIKNKTALLELEKR